MDCGAMLRLKMNPLESGTSFLSSEGILMASDMGEEEFGKISKSVEVFGGLRG
jgi:hypothetical protein